MSEMQTKQRSAVVFGARNLGRAVIDLLVSDGWAVTGVARSRSTLDNVSASGALALEADVTNPASVYGVLEQAAAAHGGIELVLNAAAAYGGGRSGPFGGGPIADADLDGFDSWAAAPARAAFSFLSASGRFAIAQGRAATLVFRAGSPMPSSSWPTRARAPRHTSSCSPRSLRTGPPELSGGACSLTVGSTRLRRFVRGRPAGSPRRRG